MVLPIPRFKTEAELLSSGWKKINGEDLFSVFEFVKDDHITLLDSMWRDAQHMDPATIAKGSVDTCSYYKSITIPGYNWCYDPDHFVGTFIAPSDVEQTGCECAKEKHGFSFHERWCPDYRHAFDVKAVAVVVQDYRTKADHRCGE